MSSFFANGVIVDWILGLMVLEALALLVWHRRTGRGIGPLELCANFLAGGFLLLGLRAALLGLQWPVIALALGAALIAHGADLVLRWSRPALSAGGRFTGSESLDPVAR